MTERPARRAVENIDRLAGAALDDARVLRATLLDEIGRNIDFDAYAWLLTDPQTEVGSDPLADVPCLPELPRLIRLKYSTDVNRWTHLATPVGRLHADTRGQRERSLVWREMLCRYDVADVASVVFRDRLGCWGFLDLWRTGRDRFFTERDSTYLGAVVPAVTQALRRSQAHSFGAVPAAAFPPGPVVMVLSPDLQVGAQTGETEAYLRALVPPSGDGRPVPAGAYNVAAQLLASEAGVDGHPPRARVHLPGGAWLGLRAARIAAGGDAAPADIAVTIDAASVAERMDLFSRAHGLTPREAEVVAALSRGTDTRQVAQDLSVSQNTVQDHLKSIFGKTGTRNRRALMARALGS